MVIAAKYSSFHCFGHSIETRSCIFRNLCFTKSKWYFYQDEKLVTQLPADTLSLPTLEVTSDALFPGGWGINLATGYPHERVKYEHKVTKNVFGPPIIQDFPIPNATWIEGPIFLFVRTQNDENAGHVVWDTYFPLLTTIATHLGKMKYAMNVTTVDSIYRGDSFAYKLTGHKEQRTEKKSQYETGWKINIGSKLFLEQLTQREFRIRNNKITGLVCYKKVLIGCGRLSGLQGKTAHHHAHQYLRETMWEKYADSDSPPMTTTSTIPNMWNFSSTMFTRYVAPVSSQKVVKILMLEKVTSFHSHTNFINNWNDIVSSVKTINHTSVISIIPHKLPFSHQVNYYKQADIVISLWGGISMLNFLIPPGGVEILITSWNPPLMPFPINSENKVLICPDSDEVARNSLGENKILKFCTRTNGTSETHINVRNIVGLIKHAVKYLRYKSSIRESH